MFVIVWPVYAALTVLRCLWKYTETKLSAPEKLKIKTQAPMSI